MELRVLSRARESDTGLVQGQEEAGPPSRHRWTVHIAARTGWTGIGTETSRTLMWADR